jgi:hypothetical protein
MTLHAMRGTATVSVLAFFVAFSMFCIPSLVVAHTSRCADQGGEDFVCSQDLLLLRERLDGRSVNVGLAQRIDGSEEERQEIRDVLKHMDEYFLNEALAMPEYDNIRHLW